MQRSAARRVARDPVGDRRQALRVDLKWGQFLPLLSVATVAVVVRYLNTAPLLFFPHDGLHQVLDGEWLGGGE